MQVPSLVAPVLCSLTLALSCSEGKDPHSGLWPVTGAGAAQAGEPQARDPDAPFFDAGPVADPALRQSLDRADVVAPGWVRGSGEALLEELRGEYVFPDEFPRIERYAGLVVEERTRDFPGGELGRRYYVASGPGGRELDHGPDWQWYDDGLLHVKRTWKRGTLEGPCAEWHKSSVRKS